MAFCIKDCGICSTPDCPYYTRISFSPKFDEQQLAALQTRFPDTSVIMETPDNTVVGFITELTPAELDELREEYPGLQVIG